MDKKSVKTKSEKTVKVKPAESTVKETKKKVSIWKQELSYPSTTMTRVVVWGLVESLLITLLLTYIFAECSDEVIFFANAFKDSDMTEFGFVAVLFPLILIIILCIRLGVAVFKFNAPRKEK